MRFDPRHWNLLAGAAITALAGCGIPSSVPLALTIGEESEGEDGMPEEGEEGEDGEDGVPECQTDADCAFDERCSPGGYCYFYDYCGDQNNPERCQPPDGDWGDGDGDGDGDCDPRWCGFGSDCDDGEPFCVVTPEVPPCAPNLINTEIPVDVLPPGVLHFAQADDDPEEEAILVSQESVWLLAPDDGSVKLERTNPAGAPESVVHMDLDQDGIDELLISDAFGNTVVFPLNGEAERTEALHGPLDVVDLEGDGSTFIASFHDNRLSILNWVDGVLGVLWEFDAIALLGAYSPNWSAQQQLGWASWIVNDAYAIRSSGLISDVFETSDLLPEPYPATSGAGLELTREGVEDLVVQASSGGFTKIRVFGDDHTTMRGMVPGFFGRKPTHTVVDEYPAIVSLGDTSTVVTLVDPNAGLLCYQALPYYHSAVGGDFDHDGSTELLVQYPNGTVATIGLE